MGSCLVSQVARNQPQGHSDRLMVCFIVIKVSQWLLGFIIWTRGWEKVLSWIPTASLLYLICLRGTATSCQGSGSDYYEHPSCLSVDMLKVLHFESLLFWRAELRNASYYTSVAISFMSAPKLLASLCRSLSPRYISVMSDSFLQTISENLCCWILRRLCYVDYIDCYD